MGRQRVRNMPRQQQKAVFASIDPDSGYLKRLESAEQYRRRRTFLIKKKDLEEDAEDKIFKVWASKKLTHRQKMSKVREIQDAATKKLASLKKEEQRQTVTGEIREIRARKFEKKAELEEEGKKKKVGLKFGQVLYKDAFKTKAEATEIENELMEKGKVRVSSFRDKDGDYNIVYEEPDKPVKRLTSSEKRKLDKLRQTQAKFIEGRPLDNPGLTRAKRNLERTRKRLGLKDTDGDGVPDHRDCEPNNPKKQDFLTKREKKALRSGVNIAQAIAKKLKKKSAKERIQAAETRIASVKAQQKAENLELEADARERLAKSKQKKRFGLF